MLEKYRKEYLTGLRLDSHLKYDLILSNSNSYKKYNFYIGELGSNKKLKIGILIYYKNITRKNIRIDIEKKYIKSRRNFERLVNKILYIIEKEEK